MGAKWWGDKYSYFRICKNWEENAAIRETIFDIPETENLEKSAAMPETTLWLLNCCLSECHKSLTCFLDMYLKWHIPLNYGLNWTISNKPSTGKVQAYSMITR